MDVNQRCLIGHLYGRGAELEFVAVVIIHPQGVRCGRAGIGVRLLELNPARCLEEAGAVSARCCVHHYGTGERQRVGALGVGERGLAVEVAVGALVLHMPRGARCCVGYG